MFPELGNGPFLPYIFQFTFVYLPSIPYLKRHKVAHRQRQGFVPKRNNNNNNNNLFFISE
jgi:hypothetical protein